MGTGLYTHDNPERPPGIPRESSEIGQRTTRSRGYCPVEGPRKSAQKREPMEKSKTLARSSGRRLMGKPHSKRRGPMGLNQRMPAP